MAIWLSSAYRYRRPSICYRVEAVGPRSPLLDTMHRHVFHSVEDSALVRSRPHLQAEPNGRALCESTCSEIIAR